MTDADATLLRRVNARIRQLQPGIAAGLEASLDRLRELVGTVAFLAALRRFDQAPWALDAVLAPSVLDRAFAPLRLAIRRAVEEGMRLTAVDFPRKATASILFDYLNPNVVEAIRALANPVLERLKADARETVRAFIEQGLRTGVHPREVARSLRGVIGLSPNQSDYVTNYRRELAELDPAALERVLRDRRFDSVIKSAIASGKPLSAEKIDQIATAYERRWTKYAAEVNTKQATFDSYRTGQRLAWDQAIDNGFVTGALVKTWVHSPHVRFPRPLHVEYGRERLTVPYDQPFPDGQQTAGFGSWGCKCSTRYSVKRAA